MARTSWNGPDEREGYVISVQYGRPAPIERVQPAASDPDAPAEFRRFQALSRGLLKVPKKELDEKLNEG